MQFKPSSGKKRKNLQEERPMKKIRRLFNQKKKDKLLVRNKDYFFDAISR